MDKLIYPVGISGPLMTLPQVWTIWSNQNARGINIFTWGWYVLIGVVWFIYGLIHKEKPIIFVQILWLIVDVLIVLGVILYG